MELELKILELDSELELKTGIEFLLPQHLLVNQPLQNFNFNKGHNISCGCLLMQQVISSGTWDFIIVLGSLTGLLDRIIWVTANFVI